MAATATIANPRNEEYVAGGDVLATWWRQTSPGTYYWRCLIPARKLPGQVLWYRTSDLAENSAGDIVFPRQEGTAIWQFPGNATTGTLMAGMQDHGYRVLMEVDDSYLHIPDVGLHGGWQAELDRSGTSDSFSLPAHEKLARFVDGIIVSTPELEALYGEINPNIYLCPNSIDPADWPGSQSQPGDVLRIGWAASHSHITDAPLIRRALMWAAEQKDVEVWVFGIGEVYKFPGAVKRAPWTDNLADYRESISRCDVMVCPLKETAWSRFKSDLKAMEAAMAGAWPIVSSAVPYKPWHDRTMVCTTAKDWEQALKWVVRHRDQIPNLAKEAKDYIMSSRLIEQSVHLWREAVAG